MKMLKYSLVMISALAVSSAAGHFKSSVGLATEKHVEIKVKNLTDEKIWIDFRSGNSMVGTFLKPDEDTVITRVPSDTKNHLLFWRPGTEAKIVKHDDPEVGSYIFADNELNQPLTLLLLKTGQTMYAVKTSTVATLD